MYVSFTYAFNSADDRRDLWDNIIQYAEHMAEHEWILLGDFNVTLDESEVLGGIEESPGQMDFQAFMAAADLTTVPMQGALFTWCNNRGGLARIWKRLDRVIANPSWLIRYSLTSYLSAPPRTSDHSPLVMTFGDTNETTGNIFRFDNFLVRDPNFLTIVSQDPLHPLGILDEAFPLGSRQLGLHAQTRLSAIILNGQWHWSCPNTIITRKINEHLPVIYHGEEDGIRWTSTANGRFSTQSARNFLREKDGIVILVLLNPT
ncbi:hypothetical protein BUALT_Bualt11G0044000 [Buddleja alternifolia]|uniref:Endonuclease/exonuclease/phosphatase domain-containing protein n=1 Tax=Buddleja alternifolia TaxID=168488 RepID=A0AAV6X3C3_9LAMI|nr:hypothetical protein BUALT_Bualt11G0044000 [Buddleja alternifolia]